MASLGLASSVSYVSKYVLSVSVANTGVLTITLQNEPSLSTASGGTVQYTPTAQGGNLVWNPSCSFANKWCPKK